MSSLFTKIIRSEIPSYKIFEDDLIFSFLALDQVNLGHTLVVPKIEINGYWDCPEPHYTAVFQAAKKITLALLKTTGCPRVATVIAGFEVPHFHYHLIPAWGISDISFAKAQRRTPEEMSKIQLAIQSCL